MYLWAMGCIPCGNGPSLVLRNYQKSGFWEANLKTSLDDGEWNTGKELMLLLRGATSESIEQLRQAAGKLKVL